MLCPECHAEYLDHIKECGDCKVDLANACPIDIPIPEMTWSPLTPFEGKVYADMATELLDKYSIPYYLKMDWTSSAFGIEAASITGQVVRIFVPEVHFNKANELASSITGKIK
tara:strand:- start:112 stop:450 length:339 start_codon:yes stop_codon:yes gene_type:complete